MMGHSSFDPEGAAGHRERLRERYRKAGHDGLLDYEKLELLLTFAISRRDVKPIAKAMLKTFGSLSGIMDAPVDRLTEVPGVGPNVALLISAVRMAKSRSSVIPRSFHSSVRFCRMAIPRKRLSIQSFGYPFCS